MTTVMLRQDLQNVIHKRPDRVAFVVGSGVARGAIAGSVAESYSTWSGLIRSGLVRARAIGKLNDDELDTYERQLGHSLPQSLVNVASIVEQALGAPSHGEFRRWLRETVGSFENNLRDRSVLDALAEHRRRGALLVTTNYDLLLEHITGLFPVTWTDAANVARVLREPDDPQILHLHGAWRWPESVVLGLKSYEDILRDEHARAVLTALRTDRTLVFVGCGAGLRDPNLGAFLAWTTAVFAGCEARHFRLCLDSEKEIVRQEHPDGQRIFPLPYGPKHTDLASFLNDLLSPRSSTHARAASHRGISAGETGDSEPQLTHVLQVVAPIGDHRPSIADDEIRHAVAPRVPIDEGLSLALDHPDGTATLYEQGAALISQKVAGFLEHRVGTSATKHLSIFGFAPMPLLMRLGRTIGDKHPAEVYERHRHTDSWRWDDEGSKLEWSASFPDCVTPGRPVALLLSVSATVTPAGVREALGGDFEAIELGLPQPQRAPNVVRTRTQLREFAEAWRATLNRIKDLYDPPELHLFPAAPLSVCIELGRRLLPKADPNIVVYDRFGGGYVRALSLRGPEPSLGTCRPPHGPSATLEASGPRLPAVSPDQWHRALYDFFLIAFNNHNLRQFFTLSLSRELVHGLPSAEVEHDWFCHRAVELLQNHGACDNQFFEALRLARPARRAEIDAIQIGCLGGSPQRIP